MIRSSKRVATFILVMSAAGANVWIQPAERSAAAPVLGKRLRPCNPLSMEASSRDGFARGVNLGSGEAFEPILDKNRNTIAKLVDLDGLPPTTFLSTRSMFSDWSRLGNSPLGIIEPTFLDKGGERYIRAALLREVKCMDFEEMGESSQATTEEATKDVVAIEIPNLRTLPYVVDQVAGKKIVYIGESHTSFSDHVMELDLIKNLHGKGGKKVAIGMEMFQRPFQKAVDDYIEGRTDEREFLRATEYFKRWGYDYRLYRPILQFARQEGIPVVALNIRKEIVEKVFRSGLDSLSEEERRSLPSQMDFADQQYKKRLEQIFKEHQGIQDSNFGFFYQAQIVWDETMADSVARFLQSHPASTMIVLAGSGHLAFGDGIPKRVANRNGSEYAILLNDEDPEKGIADYILFSPAVPFVASPMLMISLVEEEGKVIVAGFPHGHIPRAGGLKVGDIILSFEDTPIHSIEDVKIDLLYREKGEKIKVRIRRKRWLLGDKETILEVMLSGS
jgi:uncharacterized iron-regulated protein